MKLVVASLVILGLTLTQSTPVAKKVDKRTAIESMKSEMSPKFLNGKDDTEKFKLKTLKSEESKIEKFIDEKKDEQVKEGQDLKREDKLNPEDDSETLEVDREKKSCKTVKTPAPPPTKICLEIAGSPGEVEICQDDAPAPQSPEQQIMFEPQPVFEMPQQVICEQPQMMYVPPPSPPQPSTIFYEAAPPPSPPQPSTICFETAPPPPPQPSTICFESSPQQIMHQTPSVISILPQLIQPQMIQPQMSQPQMVQPQMVQPQMVQPQMIQPQMVQPQMVQPQMIQHQMVQPQIIRIQPECLQPQTIQFQPNKVNFQPTKLHHHKRLFQGNRHSNANVVQPSAPIMQYPAQSQLTTCTCQVAGGNSFSSVPVSSATFAVNPTGPTAPGASVAISDIGESRHSGVRMHAPMMKQQQPLMIQTQPRMVQQQQQQPITLQSQPITLQSQPMMVQSQPRMVQSQPMMTQSQPMMVQSQPKMVQTQPMMTQSQPITVQSQPMMVQSQPRMVQQQQQQQPITLQSQPITLQSQPMMVQTQPRMVQSQQPMMIQQEPVLSARVSGPCQAVDLSLSPMSGQMRHTRDESGSPSHDPETEKNPHNQSPEKEEQATQISLNQASSSPPTLRINNSHHQSSQNRFSQSKLMSDNSNTNDENIDNIRSIDIQGPGMQSFSFGRSLQKLKDDGFSNNERFENRNGM